MKYYKRNLKIIIGLIITILIVITFIVNIIKDMEEDKIAIIFNENLNIEFDTNVKLSSLIKEINGSLVDDIKIDTTSLGEHVIEFKYKNIHNFTKTRKIKVNVVDTTKPVTYIPDVVTVNKGYSKDLTKAYLSGDNCDSDPKREIIGDYDFNEAGSYSLVYKISDFSGNVTEKSFVLKVINPVNNSNSNKSTNKSNSSSSKIKFADIYNKYENTTKKVGIDVSGWQGDINWKKVKEAGCDFVYIRVGYQDGFDGEIGQDSFYEKNIKGAIENDIRVGIYFNSCAKTEREALEQAKWTYEKIKDYKIDLPVSFDWENWNSFVNLKLSFYEINHIASTFIEYLESKGYKSSMYSSKNYLEKIWYADRYENIWLAQYASKADYTKKYQYWQMCNTGRIDGIYGDVDIDIEY